MAQEIGRSDHEAGNWAHCIEATVPGYGGDGAPKRSFVDSSLRMLRLGPSWGRPEGLVILLVNHGGGVLLSMSDSGLRTTSMAPALAWQTSTMSLTAQRRH